MNNNKLSFNEMKEMLNLFIQLKLNALKIGDLEIQKNHYEAPPSDNKTSFQQEDPMFFSAPPLPPELQEIMSKSMRK